MENIEDKLLPHVENLVPGVATLYLLLAEYQAVLKWPSSMNKAEAPSGLFQALHDNEFLLALIFLAIAYLVGVVVYAASRFVVNTISALTLRWVFLAAYSKIGGIEWKKLPWTITKEYKDTVRRALYANKKSLARREIVKRRERGRLISAALLPAFLVSLKCPHQLAAIVVTVVGVVFLYACTEVAVYEEARLAEPFSDQNEQCGPTTMG